MAGPTTQVLNEDLKDLKDEVHKIALGLTELRTEVGYMRGIAKWAIGLMTTLIIAGFSAIGAAIWWAGATDAKMNKLDTRVEQIQSTLDRRETVLKIDQPPAIPATREMSHKEVKDAPK